MAPEGAHQELFLVEEPDRSVVTTFLMSVPFNDVVQNIYLVFFAVLLLVMTLMVIIKIEVQRHDVLVHVIGIMLLLSTLIIL
jgi:hypothetical protein